MKKKNTYFALSLVTAIALTSCSNQINNTLNSTAFPKLKNNQKGFDYKTSNDIQVNIKAVLENNISVDNVKFDLYKGDPDKDGQLITTGTTDNNGMLNTNITIPSYLESLYIKTDHIGFANKVQVKIVNNQLSYDTSNDLNLIKEKNISDNKNFFKLLADSGFKFLGSFDNQGVPSYLEKTNDVIDKTFLADINASIPEGKPVPTYHKEYLENANDKSLVLTEDAEVWVTFVHEGAGWLNSLGYYVYDTNNPPQKASDIVEKNILFPNVSYKNSGGGLVSGNKIYLGKFPKGKTISWFLVSQGWKNGTVTNGVYTVYSDQKLNPEATSTLKQHSILLNDKTRKRFIIGLEDIRRDWTNCDNDFNDAIFYFTANPYTAVKQDSLPPVTTPLDTDKDGITDTFDEYPNDATKAFTTYSPAKNQYGTLAFEDNWPKRGDNDHNDLNLDYNFVNINNASNLTVELNGNFVVNSIGAAYKNGFAIELPVAHENVESVEGFIVKDKGYIKLDTNNLEQTDDPKKKGVLVVFDNAFSLFPAQKDFINTKNTLPFINPAKVSVKVKLKNPVKISESAPYNPFLIVNQERGKEIHLPDYAPTSKATKELFKSEDDDSDATLNRFYKTSKNIPWALHFQEKWQYPKEYIPINHTYYYFSKWAESNGTEKKDWYKNIAGNFDSKQLYSGLK